MMPWSKWLPWVPDLGPERVKRMLAKEAARRELDDVATRAEELDRRVEHLEGVVEAIGRAIHDDKGVGP